MLAAIENPDPVIFLEPKRIYRASKQSVQDTGKRLPLDTCFTLRVGTDLSLVTWGAMIVESLAAADQLSSEGIEVEVIDIACIKPLDTDTILQSVEKTGRCVIVHEAARSFGVGAEIAADLAEHALLYLKAPIKRVTGYDTIMPYFQNEKYYMPDKEDILQAVRSTLAFSG